MKINNNIDKLLFLILLLKNKLIYCMIRVWQFDWQKYGGLIEAIR